MYKCINNTQGNFLSFNQPIGLHMNPENRWVKMADATRQVRKNYLALAKAKKRSTRKIRATIRKQLAYIKRHIGYLESYMEAGYTPASKEISLLMTIYKLYEQQQYMYQNKVHSVENRIVSISQPWIRPIVRGNKIVG